MIQISRWIYFHFLFNFLIRWIIVICISKFDYIISTLFTQCKMIVTENCGFIKCDLLSKGCKEEDFTRVRSWRGSRAIRGIIHKNPVHKTCPEVTNPSSLYYLHHFISSTILKKWTIFPFLFKLRHLLNKSPAKWKLAKAYYYPTNK